MICVSLIFLSFSFILETEKYIELQKDARPHVYRIAEYYAVNQDGKYQLRDELGYIWTLDDIEINRNDHYLIKVNLGQVYEDKGDDVLEFIWVKIK